MFFDETKTSMDVGDQGYGYYGVFVVARGAGIELYESMLLYADRAVLHAALQHASTGALTLVRCGCGDAGCTSFIVFNGKRMLFKRRDMSMCAIITQRMYATFLAATSEAYEAGRIADEEEKQRWHEEMDHYGEEDGSWL